MPSRCYPHSPSCTERHVDKKYTHSHMQTRPMIRYKNPRGEKFETREIPSIRGRRIVHMSHRLGLRFPTPGVSRGQNLEIPHGGDGASKCHAGLVAHQVAVHIERAAARRKRQESHESGSRSAPHCQICWNTH